ncbi:MAG: sulfite exporter TauE/SafE family protein [Alphaproteobacteria bacterium]|nr:sulfite exporter TauE/SafE family protein [Alphaproteobacteria bacterium]
MYVYLPIAEISVNVFLILAMGTAVGFLSGLFGVGGGFLMTPLLIFAGIPPAVAVGTEANKIVASSVSGVFAHWRRGNVDVKMGLVLLVGGFIGSSLGVWLFGLLRAIGQIDLVIRIAYVIFLGIVGGLMLLETARTVLRARRKAPARKLHQHTWLHGLPFKIRFRRSKLYISALLPLFVGFAVGVLAAIMGVGGGFIMVPAMIYLLGMPTSVVIGTSLFQILFVTANVTFLQALHNQTVDIVLGLFLVLGGVVGAQLGVMYGTKLRADWMRALLGTLVIAVGAKLFFDLVATPDDMFTLGDSAGMH